MTTSTRRPPPMEIYQDPDVSFAARTEHDVETALLNALRPISNASNKANMSLNPTTAPSDGSSPRKQDSSPHRPSSSYHLSEIKISPPHTDLYGMSPSKDGSFYPMYHQVNPMPKSLYPVMADKENYDKAAFSHIQEPQFSTELDPYTAPMKRAFIDTSSMRPVKRQRFEDEEDYFDLPDPKDMPPVQDDGTKPTHSYATLIGMAILRAPQRRLTLAQIYKWISDNYTFYQLADAGWQNSIRHNLSLNKNFIKRERPKDDPGKGNYWAIKPGQEKTYITDRKTQLRRLTNPDGSQVFAPDMAGFRPVSAPAIGHFTLAPNPGRKAEIRQVDVAKFPDETELSSDGTIPGSDAGVEDDIDASMMPPPPARIRSSPPPQDFGSSPPTMSSSFRRGTPPPASRFPSTSRSGGRKRKIAALNDSGYFSSIESSAARGATHQLNSELDAVRPRIKKGRAEEEIARIRSSSIDSPSKAHRRANTVHYTSSPAHKEHHPLTPALPLKREAKPPKSNSPTTNLRNHRNRIKALLGSPAKTFSPNVDAHNWSPAFICADDLGLTPGISPLKTAKTPWKFYTGSTDASLALPAQSFDIFVDDDLPARGSPEKRSTKRPSLVRAATSAGILADVTGTSKGNITLTPAEESPFSISPFLLKPDYASNPLASSPLKHCQAASDRSSAAKVAMVSTEVENVRPSDLIAKKETVELFGTELRSDSSEEMIDIFQDFGKIGQMKPLQPVAGRGNGSPLKRNMGPPMRPPMLNRAQSNRW